MRTQSTTLALLALAMLASLSCLTLSLPAATPTDSPSEPGATEESAPTEAAPRYERGNLFIEVLTPTDEQVTSEAEITVSGKAPAETILSINEEILLASADGSFTAIIPLEMGANTIEILASNYEGDELSIILTVFRE